MTVIHPRITSTKPRKAESILKSMERALEKRKEGEYSRKEFLRAWARLRRDLRRTKEYAHFTQLVRDRACGVCERCGGVGRHVHHKRPLAFAVRLALDPDNGELLCLYCHTEIHPWMARRRGSVSCQKERRSSAATRS